MSCVFGYQNAGKCGAPRDSKGYPGALPTSVVTTSAEHMGGFKGLQSPASIRAYVRDYVPECTEVSS